MVFCSEIVKVSTGIDYFKAEYLVDSREKIYLTRYNESNCTYVGDDKYE